MRFFILFCLTWNSCICAADPVLDRFASLRGLIVHVGPKDPGRTLTLATATGAVLHVLTRNPKEIAEAVHAAAVDTRVGVEFWALPQLPYGDRSVDLLVAENECGVEEIEIQRVLVPGGTALIAKNDTWKTLTGSPAIGADDWTHARHGADGNAVSRDIALKPIGAVLPDRLRWINDTARVWPHAIRIADGRVFLFQGKQEQSDGRVIAKTPLSAMVRCRSAWNGVLLWEGLYPNVAPHNGQHRPITTATHVYLYDKFILSLDAATGKEVARSDLAPYALIAPDDGRAGMLVARLDKTLVGLDAKTLVQRWKIDAKIPASATSGVLGKARVLTTSMMVADATEAFIVKDGDPLEILAVALKDGSVRRIGEDLSLGTDAYPMVLA